MAERPVREIMRRDEIVTAPARETVRTAARAMAAHRCGSVLVVDDDQLVGIFTERDAISRVLAAGRDPDRTPLGEVMTAEPDTIDAAAPVKEAIRRMDEFGYRHLPVMERGRLAGVISSRDLPCMDLVVMEPELEARHALAERIW
ncbi:MAG TPA: CBS domain-containing protein [Geminicoccaceae bacterium]|nr:CBS domain-containing protein [Geminicoccaceae bacterium]